MSLLPVGGGTNNLWITEEIPLLLVFFIYTTQKHDLNIPTDTRRCSSDGLWFELELELDA